MSARWTSAVSSFLLAANLIVVSLLAELELRVILQNVVAAILFIVGGVAFITHRRWAVTYTRIVVLLLFIGAAMYWYQTRQWIGLLPSMLLVLLIWQSNRLESSLKG